MMLSLTEDQVKSAVAAYVNTEKLVNIEVKPEHIVLKIGQDHDNAWFDSVQIDLAKAKADQGKR